MISYGRNITSINDQLRHIEVKQLHGLITDPSHDVKVLVSQLRALLNIDIEKYKLLKRRLPYITCPTFFPPVRNTKNFVSTTNFVLDVDHIAEKGINMDELKKKMAADERVMLYFESPSGDGLKLVFKLDEPIYDPVKYKFFYNSFCSSFARQYSLNQVVDSRTNDVARACFMSHDPNAHLNELCLPVRMVDFVDFSSEIDIFDAEREAKLIDKTEPSPSIDDAGDKLPLGGDVLMEIRQKLNPRLATKQEKYYYVPEQLDGLMKLVEARAGEVGLAIRQVSPISYGKKVVFEVGASWAEVNIFHGKKGFSAVKTPKNGSNAQLAEICHGMVNEIIFNI